MNKNLIGYSLLVICIIGYVIIQAKNDYHSEQISKSITKAQLEKNLATIEKHPIEITIQEYDNKYGTTLSTYDGKNQNAQKVEFNGSLVSYGEVSCLENKSCTQEYKHETQRLIDALQEPFWSINAIIKYFIYPLLAIIIGGLIVNILTNVVLRKLNLL